MPDEKWFDEWYVEKFAGGTPAPTRPYDPDGVLKPGGTWQIIKHEGGFYYIGDPTSEEGGMLKIPDADFLRDFKPKRGGSYYSFDPKEEKG